MRKKSCQYLCHNNFNIFRSKKIAIFIQFFLMLTYLITLRATLQGNYMLYKYVTAAKPVIMLSV